MASHKKKTISIKPEIYHGWFLILGGLSLYQTHLADLPQCSNCVFKSLCSVLGSFTNPFNESSGITEYVSSGCRWGQCTGHRFADFHSSVLIYFPCHSFMCAAVMCHISVLTSVVLERWLSSSRLPEYISHRLTPGLHNHREELRGPKLAGTQVERNLFLFSWCRRAPPICVSAIH